MRAAKLDHSSEADAAVVIHLRGEFDLPERDRLLDGFATVDNASLVIVDFEQTSYIDSVVLECFVALNAAIAKRGGRMILLGVGGAVSRLLEVTSLDGLFDIRRRLNDIPLDATPLRRLTIEARAIQRE